MITCIQYYKGIKRKEEKKNRRETKEYRRQKNTNPQLINYAQCHLQQQQPSKLQKSNIDWIHRLNLKLWFTLERAMLTCVDGVARYVIPPIANTCVQVCTPIPKTCWPSRQLRHRRSISCTRCSTPSAPLSPITYAAGGES